MKVRDKPLTNTAEAEADSGALSDASESDQSDEEIDDLLQLEGFIRSSKALEIFRERLREFVYPARMTGHPTDRNHLPIIAPDHDNEQVSDTDPQYEFATSQARTHAGTVIELKFSTFLPVDHRYEKILTQSPVTSASKSPQSSEQGRQANLVHNTDSVHHDSTWDEASQFQPQAD